jgi:Mg2+ and Co2+ transporter CorA
MSQDNSEAALIPIGIFAVVAVVHENADKIAQALKNFFTPIFQFLGQLLLYGAIVSGSVLILFVIIQEIYHVFHKKKERIEAERQEIRSSIESAQQDADEALNECSQLSSKVAELTKLTEELKTQIQKLQEESGPIGTASPAMEGNG